VAGLTQFYPEDTGDGVCVQEVSMGKVGILVLCFLSVLTCSLGAADISYEGQLSVHGAPADGWFDFRLQVFDQRDNDGSKAFGGEFLVPGVRVTDGRFSIEISPDADLTGQADLW
jgi:hypothetical protein